MSASVTSCLASLGLERDASERDIRRAYASRLKQLDLGEDPAGFEALRAAYETALFHVRSGQAEDNWPEPVTEDADEDTWDAQIFIPSDEPVAFSRMRDLVQAHDYSVGAWRDLLNDPTLDPPEVSGRFEEALVDALSEGELRIEPILSAGEDWQQLIENRYAWIADGLGFVDRFPHRRDLRHALVDMRRPASMPTEVVEAPSDGARFARTWLAVVVLLGLLKGMLTAAVDGDLVLRIAMGTMVALTILVFIMPSRWRGWRITMPALKRFRVRWLRSALLDLPVVSLICSIAVPAVGVVTVAYAISFTFIGDRIPEEDILSNGFVQEMLAYPPDRSASLHPTADMVRNAKACPKDDLACAREVLADLALPYPIIAGQTARNRAELQVAADASATSVSPTRLLEAMRNGNPKPRTSPFRSQLRCERDGRCTARFVSSLHVDARVVGISDTMRPAILERPQVLVSWHRDTPGSVAVSAWPARVDSMLATAGSVPTINLEAEWPENEPWARVTAKSTSGTCTDTPCHHPSIEFRTCPLLPDGEIRICPFVMEGVLGVAPPSLPLAVPPSTQIHVVEHLGEPLDALLLSYSRGVQGPMDDAVRDAADALFAQIVEDYLVALWPAEVPWELAAYLDDHPDITRPAAPPTSEAILEAVRRQPHLTHIYERRGALGGAVLTDMFIDLQRAGLSQDSASP